METLCVNCQKVLTSESGKRVENAIFDSRLQHIRDPMLDLSSPEVTWAWCRDCHYEVTRSYQ